MLDKPEKVHKFLNCMQEGSGHVFQKNMEVLQKAKAYLEGGGDVEPWGVPLYCPYQA